MQYMKGFRLFILSMTSLNKIEVISKMAVYGHLQVRILYIENQARYKETIKNVIKFEEFFQLR